MNRQVFRSNEQCLRDRGESLCLDSRMANMNVSSVDACDGSTISTRFLSPSEKSSFDHIVASHRSYSVEIEEREDFEVPVFRKLSSGRSREIPFREMAADSRDPEDEDYQQHLRSDNDERTEAVGTQSQDVSVSQGRESQGRVSRRREDTSEAQASGNGFLGSISSLKRANPIYESDNEVEEVDESYPQMMRKRRCSIDRMTTAVYWQHQFKLTDE